MGKTKKRARNRAEVDAAWPVPGGRRQQGRSKAPGRGTIWNEQLGACQGVRREGKKRGPTGSRDCAEGL